VSPNQANGFGLARQRNMEKAMEMTRSGFILLIALAAGSATAFAQVPPPAPDMQDMRANLNARFTAADFNHDGKLTRDEAAKMPMVARNFDQIDKAHKGYVTLDEIQAFTRERMAERRAAKAGTTN
jgi:EF hand